MKFMKFLVALVTLAVVYGRIHKRRARGPNGGPNSGPNSSPNSGPNSRPSDLNHFLDIQLNLIFNPPPQLNQNQEGIIFNVKNLFTKINDWDKNSIIKNCLNPVIKLIDNVKNKKTENSHFTYFEALKAVIHDANLRKESCGSKKLFRKRKYFY
jgi:hypothetical protein